jgi:hypothetical protein
MVSSKKLMPLIRKTGVVVRLRMKVPGLMEWLIW